MNTSVFPHTIMYSYSYSQPSKQKQQPKPSSGLLPFTIYSFCRDTVSDPCPIACTQKAAALTLVKTAALHHLFILPGHRSSHPVQLFVIYNACPLEKKLSLLRLALNGLRSCYDWKPLLYILLADTALLAE